MKMELHLSIDLVKKQGGNVTLKKIRDIITDPLEIANIFRTVSANGSNLRCQWDSRYEHKETASFVCARYTISEVYEIAISYIFDDDLCKYVPNIRAFEFSPVGHKSLMKRIRSDFVDFGIKL